MALNSLTKFQSMFHVAMNCMNKKFYTRTNLNCQLFRSFSKPPPPPQGEMIPFIIEMDGKQIKTEGEVGVTLRDIIAGLRKDVGEDFGICDGTVACSTCHVVFSESDFEKIPFEPTQEEMDVLDVVPNLTDTSRLSCAINVSPELKNIVVKVPSQRNDARTLSDAKEM